MKIMAFIAPGMFKKQSKLIQQRFKEFAESAWDDENREVSSHSLPPIKEIWGFSRVGD